ncbi:lytic transglycosylase domain-containing protein [Streptomyces sp. ACA25]|uniref:lytic transglycosylase domain-containing protein n=1 Tax=Streptomyces sp. ACA25 TaxID=3022596 RepID=UPI002FE3730A
MSSKLPPVEAIGGTGRLTKGSAQVALRRGRVRRGISGSAVAAVAMAALTASQASELVAGDPSGQRDARESVARQEPTPPDRPHHTELPPLDTGQDPAEDGPGEPAEGGSDVVTGPAEAGIPATVLDAYRKAEAALAQSTPGCNLEWELLAAIGKVESGHARGGAVDGNGTTHRPILGPALDGNGFALIKDTDGGRWDGDRTFDRAVGPMQFIPSTWAVWGADGNGDGKKDPNNVYDATLAAGNYLCAAGRDLSRAGDLDRALLSYNPSREYVRTVTAWLDYYRKSSHEVPDGTGQLPGSPGAGSGTGGGHQADRNGKDSSKDRSRDSVQAGEKPGHRDRADQDPAGGPDRDRGRSPGAVPAEPTPTRPGPGRSEPGAPKPTPSPAPTPSAPAPSPTPTPEPTEPEPSPTEPSPEPTEPEPSPTEPSPEPTEPEPSPTPPDCPVEPEPEPSGTPGPSESPDPTPSGSPSPSSTPSATASPSPSAGSSSGAAGDEEAGDEEAGDEGEEPGEVCPDPDDPDDPDEGESEEKGSTGDAPEDEKDSASGAAVLSRRTG